MLKFFRCDMCGEWAELTHHIGDGWEEWEDGHTEGCEGEGTGLTYEEIMKIESWRRLHA